MKLRADRMTVVTRLLVAATFAFVIAAATTASAQVPPRFYWKSLSGGQAVPLIYMPMNGNANPADPAHVVTPGATVEALLAPVGYARMFELFDRAAMAAILVPMGRISSDIVAGLTTVSARTSGFGDPLAEFVINLVGPPPIRNIPDMLRYEPGFSLDLLVDLSFPLGEYDSEQPLNIGQNRWYGRVGAPIVWQLGAWVPGRRTTLEFLPSLWVYGDNTDFVGATLETEPKFQVEGHLTRDFVQDLWGSLDCNWVTGGKATIDGVAGSELDNLSLGYTLGYHVNENLQVTFGYMSTVNDNEDGDLQMDGFKVSAVFGWHPLIEGMERLGSGE